MRYLLQCALDFIDRCNEWPSYEETCALHDAIENELQKPEKQPLATFTVQDGKVIDYTLTNGELPNGDYEIYVKDDL